MFIGRSIHLGNNKRVNATQMFGEFVVCRLQWLTMPAPRCIYLVTDLALDLSGTDLKEMNRALLYKEMVPQAGRPLTHPTQFHQSCFRQQFSHHRHSTIVADAKLSKAQPNDKPKFHRIETNHSQFRELGLIYRKVSASPPRSPQQKPVSDESKCYFQLTKCSTKCSNFTNALWP